MVRPFGTKQSVEARAKISLALKEQWASGVRKATRGVPRIEKNCLFCNSKILIREKLFLKGCGRFCSRKCRVSSSIGRKLSNEHKAKLSIAKKGKKASAGTIAALRARNGAKSPFWKGGLPSCVGCNKELSVYHSKTNKCNKCYGNAWIADRTKLKHSSEESKYRNSPAHKEWSRQVKNRDYWKCQISNDDCSGRVEAHHILGWKDHPELRYEIKNGITLCHFHHPRKRSEEERYVIEFQQLVAAKMN